MKAGALILAVLFVIMSVQPMFIKWSGASCSNNETRKIASQTGSCKPTCSSTAKKVPAKQPVQEKGGDPCNTCNPFMVCNGCPYFPVEAPELLFPGMIDPDNTHWLIDGSVSSFQSDAWHPPELFMRL